MLGIHLAYCSTFITIKVTIYPLQSSQKSSKPYLMVSYRMPRKCLGCYIHLGICWNASYLIISTLGVVSFPDFSAIYFNQLLVLSSIGSVGNWKLPIKLIGIGSFHQKELEYWKMLIFQYLMCIGNFQSKFLEIGHNHWKLPL